MGEDAGKGKVVGHLRHVLRGQHPVGQAVAQRDDEGGQQGDDPRLEPAVDGQPVEAGKARPQEDEAEPGDGKAQRPQPVPAGEGPDHRQQGEHPR